MAKFVPGEQAKLCGDTFRLPVLTPSGEKQMRPIELSQAQIEQVFGDGRIRTIAEQKPFMLAAPPARRQTVQDVPATLTGDALLFGVLGFSAGQKADLTTAAEGAGVSCAALVSNMLLYARRECQRRRLSGAERLG